MAIHKSVASFVDKGYRENAKASTCYSRKEGEFLPQYHTIMNPEFKKEYKDKMQSKNMIGMINSFKNEEEDIVEPYLTKEMFYKNEIDIKDREIERLKELIKKAENTLTQLYDEKVSLLSQKNTLKNMVLDYTNRGNNGSTTNIIK